MQLNRKTVIIAENSNSNCKKTIITLPSSYEYLNLDTKFNKKMVEINRMKKVMNNVDKFSSDFMKNLFIKNEWMCSRFSKI